MEMEVCYLEDSNFHSKSQTQKELLELPVLIKPLYNE